MTHSEAVRMVRGKRNATSRKIGNNTRAFLRDDNSVDIVLHSTPVVTIREDGTYILRTGGWQTVTTKDRINQYSPVKVYQRKFSWYVTIHGKEYDFVNGMVVS